MPSCLLALGSNLGDREATLEAALTALEAAPATNLCRHSRWHRSRPVGMAGSRQEFLNGAALVETSLEPHALLEFLQRIEIEHGRRSGADWVDRTLDLDLLLYDDRILDTPAMTVPHPRMSFRRFVLEPAAEIAGDLLHPVLGWTIERLRNHLNQAADLAAVVSPREPARRELVAALVGQLDLQVVDPPAVEEAGRLWPGELTTWVRLPATAVESDLRTGTDLPKEGRVPAARLPKLSILLDVEPVEPVVAGGEAGWAALVRQTGRGPTLRVRARDPAKAERDALAAFEAVWPHLGS